MFDIFGQVGKASHHHHHHQAVRLKIAVLFTHQHHCLLISKGNEMHVQATKGTTFSISIIGATDTGAKTSNVPAGLPVFAGFDANVISVGSPTEVAPGEFVAQVTVLADSGSTTIYAALEAVQGSISVSVKEVVAAPEVPPAPKEDTEPPATNLIITASGDGVEVISA